MVDHEAPEILELVDAFDAARDMFINNLFADEHAARKVLKVVGFGVGSLPTTFKSTSSLHNLQGPQRKESSLLFWVQSTYGQFQRAPFYL